MNLQSLLLQVAHSYPEDGMVKWQTRDIPRIQFGIELALNGSDPKGLRVLDIGGGLSMFAPGCAALGMQSVLVDDFNDTGTVRDGDAGFTAHRKFGVEVMARDVIRDGLGDLGTFDIITTFDSMEHWHSSPKQLFAEVKTALKPSGIFVLGVPNCVNLRKRITVPLGYGKWSQMSDWYEQTPFRGHVREPDVADLHYIASDMGLRDVRIYGRNWQGYKNGRSLIRAVTSVIDRPLRLFPALCADLYLTARAH